MAGLFMHTFVTIIPRSLWIQRHMYADCSGSAQRKTLRTVLACNTHNTTPATQAELKRNAESAMLMYPKHTSHNNHRNTKHT
jgi:hypothetical protein